MTNETSDAKKSLVLKTQEKYLSNLLFIKMSPEKRNVIFQKPN
jgi:hypothetical protein